MEFIVGAAAAAVVVGVTSATASQKTKMVTPPSFERKYRLASESSGAHCGMCSREISASEARIMFAADDGSIGLVCNRTDCLLAYAHGDRPGATEDA